MCGVADGVQGDERKQEVAEQGGGGARGGVAVSVLLARRKTTGEGGGGGLGQREDLGRLGWTGRRQVGSVLFIFFLFSVVCFDLV